MRPGYRALASALAVVGLVAGVILWRAGEREFHLNTDETQHAVTGLFVADFLRDLPLTEPRAYAFRYYAQYPALGLVHWPPMFYLAEGLMFRLCGASAWTARITICLFAVLGLVYWMRLVAALDGPLTATLSGLILGWLPYMLLYEKAVMLEIPSLALCIACSYYWYRYLEGSSWSLIGVACLSTLAILTKQQSLYLAPFFLATVWAQRRWRDLFSPAGLIAVGIPLLPVVAFYAYSYAVHGPTIRALVGQPLQGQGNPLLFYPRALPEQLGWPLLALAALGLATARWWARRKALLFMLIWIAASFVAALAFAVKESRYTIYWIPPLVYLAVAPLCAAYRQRGVRLAARAA
ncbi:MAG TPA: glycosyltransferase family 39 protein, partial [Candidatus Polarisedimenticolaceae bacterium]|nr:glycosyltransferase family 39 protein [Candidatus Polarisedimenticolaceae bacterium]